MSKIVSVDGIIGQGKSTVLNIIKNTPTPYSKIVLLEPFESNLFLPEFYKDPSRWAYSTQCFFFMLRYRQYLYMRSAPEDVAFCERSAMSDKYTFGDMLFDSGYMTEEEYKSYIMWFSWFSTWEGLNPDITVILDGGVEEAMEFIKKRNRPMEKDITAEYQTALREKTINNRNYLGKQVFVRSGANLPKSPEGRAEVVLDYAKMLVPKIACYY